ncbi:MAG: hypothetical protein LBV68_02040 [Spirochaetaceae bacterium]|jgi:hypothetical protein|nr:hypothetical protein [Spirochaetaceae bacterium]
MSKTDSFLKFSAMTGQRGCQKIKRENLHAGFRIIPAGIFAFFLALPVSCASTPFALVDEEVSAGRYQNAEDILEGKRSSLYGSDLILYYLDGGMLSHYAGDYKQSITLLANGDHAIEDAFTKSVTENAASFLLNDNTKTYSGEDYENLYLNVFNALNYYHENNLEDAMVEIRRMENKLRDLQTKYDVVEQELQGESSSAADYTGVKINFSNSALARYLGILFYRARKQYDDARIDLNWLKRAFQRQKNVYPFPIPSTIDEELKIPEGEARLNVLSFSGLSPVKVENVIRIPIPPSNWIKIALPEMQKQPSAVTRIEIVFDSGEKYNAELLEDLQNVAIETFKIHLGVITAKSIIRGAAKGISAAGLNAAGEAGRNQKDGQGGWLTLAGLAVQVMAELSESADTRLSRYFPAQAHVLGLSLKPGKYTFSVNYYNNYGGLVDSFEQKDIVLSASSLNLIETYCLK